VGGAAAPLRASAAVTGGGCAASRGYALYPVTVELASVGVVGHVAPNYAEDTGRFEYALPLSARIAGQLQDSFNGGCRPVVRFSTAGTTGALGRGQASYQASIDLQVGGGSTGTWDEFGQHRPAGCTTIICRTPDTYEVPVPRFATTGTLIMLVASATAKVDAVGVHTGDQAYAGWRPSGPRLVIPIP
jgi:hypothetical protein